MRDKLKNTNGITLIALVVTIVVLLILAGVSISMLTGENGIITQAQESKLQTEIGKEKEYITLSVSAVKGDKISRGDTSEITSGELQNEINNYTNEATVTGNGTLTVTYESGRSYEVDQDGSITQKEELTPEEAKKIVYATGCGYNIPGLLVETADGTVYYVNELESNAMQKIEITNAEVITTNGIREAGGNYFIDNQGKVYTWGDNEYGQLGNGTEEFYSNKPICISDIEDNVLNGKNIVEIQNSYPIMIALDSEGKVYTWGDNRNWQLGNGTEEYYSNEPICISNIEGNALKGKNIAEVQSDGNTVISIDSEGKVYTWGRNNKGQLGNGSNVEYGDEPICISEIKENALSGKKTVEVTIVGETMITLDSDGKVYTWGDNGRGRLGNGSNVEYGDEPICISDIEENELKGRNIVKIQSNESEESTMIVIDSEGKVYTWGNNMSGQLGIGTEESYSNKPICISDISGNALNGKNIIKIQCDNNTIIALDNEGKIYTWGNNADGQLGNGTYEYSNKPICISDIEGNALNGKNIVKIQKDSNTTMALDNEGKLYEWGYLNGTYEKSNVPICITDKKESELYNKKIKFVNNITSAWRFSFSAYITENGELYNYIISVIPM